MTSERTGNYVQQLFGELAYKAFIPKPLPPEPSLDLNSELMVLLSRADQAIGRLDGALKSIPNHELLVMMYIKKEAVLSSQIEGTQASLFDVLEKEEDVLAGRVADDVRVTLNYIDAMNYGLKRINELPLSLRLIKEIHKILLAGVRGEEKYPGEFRKSQNWVGPKGCILKNATFVPPPVFEMNQVLGDLEKYLHREKTYPILIETGLIHVQFETIHPFVDGNGRIGRLLITLLLCANKIISQPILYLSYYFKKNRQEYYDLLTRIRELGNWEAWLKFFLKGVAEISDNVVELSNRIVELQEKNKDLVRKALPRYSSHAIELLERMYIHPVFTINKAKESCGITYNTAKSIVQKFIALKILNETIGKKRNRKYFFKEYIDLLNEGTELK